MGDRNNGDTEWVHHIDVVHVEGGKHFRGFDMQDGTFTYSFCIMNGTTPYYLKFHGTKN